MSIRERDAEFSGVPDMPPLTGPDSAQARAYDRRALLAAGDALAEAMTVFENHHRRTECGDDQMAGHWTAACQSAEDATMTALAAWKAATG